MVCWIVLGCLSVGLGMCENVGFYRILWGFLVCYWISGNNNRFHDNISLNIHPNSYLHPPTISINKAHTHNQLLISSCSSSPSQSSPPFFPIFPRNNPASLIKRPSNKLPPSVNNLNQ